MKLIDFLVVLVLIASVVAFAPGSVQGAARPSWKAPDPAVATFMALPSSAGIEWRAPASAARSTPGIGSSTDSDTHSQCSVTREDECSADAMPADERCSSLRSNSARECSARTANPTVTCSATAQGNQAGYRCSVNKGSTPTTRLTCSAYGAAATCSAFDGSTCSAWGTSTNNKFCSVLGDKSKCSVDGNRNSKCSAIAMQGARHDCSVDRDVGAQMDSFCSVFSTAMNGFCSSETGGTTSTKKCSVQRQTCSIETNNGKCSSMGGICSVFDSGIFGPKQCTSIGAGVTDAFQCSAFTANGQCSVRDAQGQMCTALDGADTGSCSASVAGARCSVLPNGPFGSSCPP